MHPEDELSSYSAQIIQKRKLRLLGQESSLQQS
jgi:hypothetical protein